MPVWVIILIVAAVAIIVFAALGCWLSEETFWYIGTLIGIVCVIACTAVGPLEHNYDHIEYENIYSIRSTNDDIEGHFFLGSGYIDEDTYYMVFVEDEKGIKLDKYDTRYTYIVEVDDGNHYVRHIKEKWTLGDYYILYVPVGTIIVEYRI
jgi:hypothetical protein